MSYTELRLHHEGKPPFHELIPILQSIFDSVRVDENLWQDPVAEQLLFTVSAKATVSRLVQVLDMDYLRLNRFLPASMHVHNQCRSFGLSVEHTKLLSICVFLRKEKMRTQMYFKLE
jgi:hypothetical protein